jgi:hypothetical protein
VHFHHQILFGSRAATTYVPTISGVRSGIALPIENVKYHINQKFKRKNKKISVDMYIEIEKKRKFKDQTLIFCLPAVEKFEKDEKT